MSDNELDNLFKEAADGFKPPNDPAAWQDMARKLDQVAVATTASFWNWKTISSTVIVGVALVASVLYVTMSDSTPGSDSNAETLTSVDAALTPADQDGPASTKTPESITAASATTQVAEKERALTNKENNQRKTDERSAAIAQSLTGDSKSDVPGKPQSGNLSAPQTLASQSSQSDETSNNQNVSAVTPGVESREGEIKKKDATAAAASLGGIAVTGKLPEPAISGDANAKEGNSSQPLSGEKESMTVVGKENSSGSTQTTTEKEKVGEPAGSVNVKSRENANQSASSAKDLKNQPIAGEGDSMKKSGENTEVVTQVVATEKTAEATSRATTGTEKENTRSGQPTSNTKGEESQSAVAAEPLQKMDEIKQEAPTKESAEEVEPEHKEEQPTLNRFAIKLAVAPDYTTVESATPNGMGINYGVLFEYRISKHWSVATGGIWSKKIYSAYDVEYSGYSADWVDGDCRMWDIPINVYYNFPSNRPFSFYASLGLSSYLMNEENYVYYVETPYGTYDYPMQIKGENNEWFKTLNVSAGMQFRMSQQFSLQFEPTLKAPLAGVGEGEVSLVSLGAFFNLRYEIPVNKLRRNDD